MRRILISFMVCVFLVPFYVQKAEASNVLTLTKGWNLVVWPNISGKFTSELPGGCTNVTTKNPSFVPYVLNFKGTNSVYTDTQKYYLKCLSNATWNLLANLDQNFSFQLSPGSGVAPLDQNSQFTLDIYMNSNSIPTKDFSLSFQFDSNEVTFLGANAVPNISVNANGSKGYESYVIFRTTSLMALKPYSIEKIGSISFTYKTNAVSSTIRIDRNYTYIRNSTGIIVDLILPQNFQYIKDPTITIAPTSTPMPTVTAGPTSTPQPTPTPCANGGAFDGNVVRNYVQYGYAGTDYNSQYPNGAPYGVIGMFAWSAIHTGNNSFNWSSIDNYIQTAMCTNKSVMIKILTYESDVPTLSNWEFSSPYQCPCPSGSTCLKTEPEDPVVATRVYHIYSDMTPTWVKNQIGSIYVPLAGQDRNNNGVKDSLDIKRCRPRKGGGDEAPDPNYCYTVAVIPKYNDPLYQTALKQFIDAFGARYKNDTRVAGVLFGVGLDNEFGEWTKGGWGDCYIKDETTKLGLMSTNVYLNTFINPNGPDYTDWYANAFFPKPVFHGVTSDAKDRVPIMFSKGHTNLGLHQASLMPDHNWYMHYGTGILELAVSARNQGYPVMFENALPIFVDYPWQTKNQQMYSEMLAQLFTFPKYYDWVQGLCFTFPNHCKWAKQYYSRTPQNTDDIWIAFQETRYPPSSGYSGWLDDYDYGLKRVSTKGTTIWRQSFADPDGTGQAAGHSEPGLLQLFNAGVADGYTGQARKININETMILAPFTTPTVWKGISGSGPFTYKVRIYYIDNGSGTIKVDIGSDTEGFISQQWDRTNTNSWQTKVLDFSGKKVTQIKITPISGDPAYLHMVRVSLPGSSVWDLSTTFSSP